MRKKKCRQGKLYAVNCVIGAGSVVNKDIPESSLVVGSPCRVIRRI